MNAQYERYRWHSDNVVAWPGPCRRELPESFWNAFIHDVERHVGELVYEATLQSFVSRIELPADCEPAP